MFVKVGVTINLKYDQMKNGKNKSVLTIQQINNPYQLINKQSSWHNLLGEREMPTLPPKVVRGCYRAGYVLVSG